MSSFALGLIVGQASVLIVAVILVRFFLFADPANVKGLPVTEEDTRVAPIGPQSLDSILEQTYYNVDTHSSESMDWFTVLLAMVISSLRRQAIANNHLLTILNHLVSSEKVPPFIDAVKVTEMNLGSDFPLLSKCKVYRTANSEVSDGLEAQFDIDLKDMITLAVEARMMLNYPRPMVAYLPVSVSVSLLNFSGRVSLSFVSDDEGQSFVTFSLAPNFNMEFRINSLIGARSKLEDVPKIGQMIESALRKVLNDKLVTPKYQKIRVPMKWAHTTARKPSESSEILTNSPQTGSSDSEFSRKQKTTKRSKSSSPDYSVLETPPVIDSRATGSDPVVPGSLRQYPRHMSDGGLRPRVAVSSEGK